MLLKKETHREADPFLCVSAVLRGIGGAAHSDERNGLHYFAFCGKIRSVIPKRERVFHRKVVSLLLFKSSAPEWLVCFLGNPGSEYAKTRHNAGWICCEKVEEKLSIRTDRLKFHAFTAIGKCGGASVLFIRPQTYMNLSGEAVQPAAAYYHIPVERVIVVQDDMALPLGKLRIKRGGSDGGHNGIKSITKMLGTQNYPRIKIGVGQPEHPDYDVIDWVIGKLSDQEYREIEKTAETAADAIEDLIANGIDHSMNQYNH